MDGKCGVMWNGVVRRKCDVDLDDGVRMRKVELGETLLQWKVEEWIK